MPRARPAFTSFNAGELSPLLDGRVDQDKYFSGCKTLQNFLPTVQGPVSRRGGTRRVASTKDSSRRSWLRRFVFSADQAYVLEFGHLYVRFFVDRGQLLSGATPYEIASPYTEEDLSTSEGTFALHTVQSGDIMWITHAEKKHRPYRLSRFGATNWTLAPEVFNYGPFRSPNTDGGKRLQASAETGTVTVTSLDFPYFGPEHIGALVQLRSQNPSVLPPYQPSQTYAVGNRIRNAGNVYECVATAAPTGTTRYVPTHTEGDAFDGAATWRYLHSGYGHGKITAVAGDKMSCTVEVIRRFPKEVVDNTTTRWAFSEISAVFGWPSEVGFFNERLVYVRDKTVFLSVVGDFTNFEREDAGLVTKEVGMQLTLASGKFDSARWIVDARGLLMGSSSSELTLQEQTTQAAFGPDNVRSVPQTSYGSRKLRPLEVGESVLFVERAGRRIRDAKYSFEIDKYKAEDVTVLAEHLFRKHGVVDWAYQQQQDSVVWCVLADGSVAAMTFNRERGVIAWAPQPFGGPDAFVEAVECIPSRDNSTDDPWFIVRRTVNGQVQRTVEYMTDYRLVDKGRGEAFHVDCGTTYRGAATTVITGLSHMEGQEVDICVNGATHPPRTVTGGSVTLNWPGTLVHVGYRFTSRFQSMRLEVQGGGGTSQGAKKGLSEVLLRVHNTAGGRYGGRAEQLDPIPNIPTALPPGTPAPLVSQDLEVTWNNGFEPNGYIFFEISEPQPATLVAIVAEAQING